MSRRQKFNNVFVAVCKLCDAWHLPGPLEWKGKCIGCASTECLRFRSKREALKFAELRKAERAGRIRDLELQPEFPVLINGIPVFKYRADFRFFEGERRRVIDVKGMDTAVSRLKRKCVTALYNVEIEVCK